ncbi:type II toxin-antitoxin system mRNA interferase toxin, RelE/StbE family [Cellvibrio sp. OA-2007]|uniref:type II toxin-antitoxin system mRNA interferase toxin, RelE/StbE family n=1 Tax=Cellvibrio sp. OA-2007 TaxID=529823 RepID=UPI0007804435
MWTIYEHRKLTKQLSKVSAEILARYEIWKSIVEISGPEGLKTITGFKDERLQGEWKGFRSSRLNIQYRVIYQINGKELYVNVVEVTPHDYKRKS